MEFFNLIDIQSNEAEIQRKINLSTLNSLVSETFVLEKENKNSARIGSQWGEFTLKFDNIKGGVRFYLQE